MEVKEFKGHGNVCPFCGKEGWCGIAQATKSQVPNAVLYVCHRSDMAKDEVIRGSDGNDYVVVGETSRHDGWWLEPLAQRNEEKRLWAMQKNGTEVFPSCPVCGGSYSCSRFPAKQSNIPNAWLYNCHGITKGKPKMEFAGKDGQGYHLIKESRYGGWLLETVEQNRKGINVWRAQNNKSAVSTDVEVGDNPEVIIQSSEHRIVKTPEERVIVPKPNNLLPNKQLHEAYKTVIRMLHLLPEHRAKLHKDGWTDELIEEYQIVSMPLTDKERWLRQKNGDYNSPEMKLPWRYQVVEAVQAVMGDDLTGIPGFYEPETADRKTGEIIRKWRMAGPTGMMFFSRDIKGHFFGAQIRLDNPGKSGKYLAWSTNPDKTDKYGNQMYPNGTSLPVQAGFIYHPERDNTGIAYITEGMKKGVIGNYHKKYPFVILPGVNQFSAITDNPDETLNIAKYLKEIGVRTIIVAYDADKAVNENVLRHEHGVAEMMHQLGFTVYLADWTIHRTYCKGLDDLLNMGLDCSYEEVKY